MRVSIVPNDSHVTRSTHPYRVEIWRDDGVPLASAPQTEAQVAEFIGEGVAVLCGEMPWALAEVTVTE